MQRLLSSRASAAGLQYASNARRLFRRPRPITVQLAQAQPAQPARPGPAAPDPAAPAADAQQAPEEPIGNVATVTGTASVVRNNTTTPLKVKDDIYLNDVVQTAANSSLGITFIDATTFNLKANAQITIDTYVYEDGGKNNAGVFDVAKGTAAFVAAAVAKTGDMKITTPTATLGIRGTTGLVEVPEGGSTTAPEQHQALSRRRRQGRAHRGQRPRRRAARLPDARRQRLHRSPRHRRRARFRGAADHSRRR